MGLEKIMWEQSHMVPVRDVNKDSLFYNCVGKYDTITRIKQVKV